MNPFTSPCRIAKLKGLTPAALARSEASKTGTSSRDGISRFFRFSTSSRAFPIIFETSSNCGRAAASYSPINSPFLSTVILSLISYT